MPRDFLRSSERSPGFFCRRRVSNSFPFKLQIYGMRKLERNRGEEGGGERRKRRLVVSCTEQHKTDLHLVIQVSVDAHLWFSLPLEEGVMKLLVVNSKLPHLGPYSLFCLLFERFCIFLLFQSLSHLHHSRILQDKGTSQPSKQQ